MVSIKESVHLNGLVINMEMDVYVVELQSFLTIKGNYFIIYLSFVNTTVSETVSAEINLENDM